MEKDMEKKGLSAMKRGVALDALLNFSKNFMYMEESYTYEEFLKKQQERLEEELNASIIIPVMGRDSFLVKELLEENHANQKLMQSILDGNLSDGEVLQIQTRLFHDLKFLIFVPLPVFERNEENQTYTVLGTRWKMSPQSISVIFTLLFSMNIFFRAQQERMEHQKMYFSMLSLMISVIDAKDPVTAGHSQRVADISRDIGIWMELSPKQQHDLEFTALLHDVGKMSVSDYVLNKPSIYTQDDFQQMKNHTVRGAEMLEKVGISPEIIDGVRHHHERMDGKGYPDGLRGNELSLFAKIIKIADVFDALTNKRQYKDAWKIEKALDIIYRGRGTEFDKEIADIFIENMRPEGWCPPMTEQEKKLLEQRPIMQKAADILEDFYRKYHDYITVGYPIPSRKANSIDFDETNGFMGFDWGENFNNSQFLEDKPVILAYEKDTQSLFFGQCSQVEGVKDVYYYFFRGFLNMGIYLVTDDKAFFVMKQLEEMLGEPVRINSDMEILMGKKYQIVHYQTYDDKQLICYISDYMCSNYVYEEDAQEEQA